MRIVVIGGGIAGVYIANRLKKLDKRLDIVVVSKEDLKPYDRIHLCKLVDGSALVNDISLNLDPTIKLELNQEIIQIDSKNNRVFSKNSMFSYNKLIIATGSKPNSLFENFDNVVTFRDANDSLKIKDNLNNRDIVLVGAGAISLELLQTLTTIKNIKTINLIVRSKYLYDKNLNTDTVKLIESYYLKDKRVTISYEDEIIDKVVKNNKIIKLKTKKLEIDNPFIIFGIGIKPNIDSFKNYVNSNIGILVNRYMQTDIENIYAIGECAEVKELNFIAGHVKECTQQADCAISHILNKDLKEFSLETTIDMLKVDEFDLIDVKSATFNKEYEKVVIASKKDARVDEYFLNNNKLNRFIGINSNIDVGYIQTVIENQDKFDLNYLYENRLVGERGRLICSCEHIYYKDLLDIIEENAVKSFADLAQYSQAGRVCGRCKVMVEDIIKQNQHLVKPTSKKLKKLDKQKDDIKKRIEKFNKLHPLNQLDSSNLEAAMESLEIEKSQINSWISMVSASMQIHPYFEDVTKQALFSLNKIPIIWLELSDCSGNSEAFLKSNNPAIEDLIFDYISLDYHELIMSASADDSETVLENIIKTQKNNYILIVEGAIPLALDGKYLRIGPKGETGIELLKRCAKDAALVLAVGSCALDGGVVAAYPNPTKAVGVSEALGRDDIINLPGCPVNPVNIVGTLLYYLMFEELPKLDKLNRPLWAYEGRIHDNCERRGHYELGEFVKEWGDEGAKKGYCLFEMGCKGPYANVNCPTMKFNDATSWPVQAGHGCMACTEVGFFDKYANERKVKE